MDAAICGAYATRTAAETFDLCNNSAREGEAVAQRVVSATRWVFVSFAAMLAYTSTMDDT